uniref:C-type lectin domain-containing protein n=1 Tax=Panagrolaimus sp. JU765 TaxID=591449 RepID=A0AC34RMY9_9BILA
MCYKMFAKSTLNFTDASNICQNQNANLVSIHSDAENSLIGKLTTIGIPLDWSIAGVWIGLTYNTTWTWTDGTPFDYQAWGSGDPDHIGSSNCVNFYPDGATGNDDNYIMKWDTSICNDSLRRTICKKNAKVIQGSY